MMNQLEKAKELLRKKLMKREEVLDEPPKPVEGPDIEEKQSTEPKKTYATFEIEEETASSIVPNTVLVISHKKLDSNPPLIIFGVAHPDCDEEIDISCISPEPEVFETTTLDLNDKGAVKNTSAIAKLCKHCKARNIEAMLKKTVDTVLDDNGNLVFKLW